MCEITLPARHPTPMCQNLVEQRACLSNLESFNRRQWFSTITMLKYGELAQSLHLCSVCHTLVPKSMNPRQRRSVTLIQASRSCCECHTVDYHQHLHFGCRKSDAFHCSLQAKNSLARALKAGISTTETFPQAEFLLEQVDPRSTVFVIKNTFKLPIELDFVLYSFP